MATSKLQRYTSEQLSIHFGKYTIRENYRPDWLSTGDGGWLELDFFIEDLDVAIEVQGKQHFEFVPFFHGHLENFEKRKEYDSIKKSRCAERGIRLFEVLSRMDLINLIDSISPGKGINSLLPISDHALRKYQKDKKRKEPKKPSIKRASKKMFQTIIAYRNSDKQKSFEYYNKLLSLNLPEAHLQSLGKRLYPNGVSNCPKYLLWIWE